MARITSHSSKSSLLNGSPKPRAPWLALEPRVEPRVYERDGFVVTLWTYYEPCDTSRGLTSRLRGCA